MAALTAHTQSHHRDSTWQHGDLLRCLRCTAVFRSAGELHKHTFIAHTGNSPATLSAVAAAVAATSTTNNVPPQQQTQPPQPPLQPSTLAALSTAAHPHNPNPNLSFSSPVGPPSSSSASFSAAAAAAAAAANNQLRLFSNSAAALAAAAAHQNSQKQAATSGLLDTSNSNTFSNNKNNLLSPPSVNHPSIVKAKTGANLPQPPFNNPNLDSRFPLPSPLHLFPGGQSANTFPQSGLALQNSLNAQHYFLQNNQTSPLRATAAASGLIARPSNPLSSNRPGFLSHLPGLGSLASLQTNPHRSPLDTFRSSVNQHLINGSPSLTPPFSGELNRKFHDVIFL